MPTCQQCDGTFDIQDRDLKFFESMGVTSPKLCPEDMARWRLSFRNEEDLYKRKCDKTGKELLTYHPPHAPYPIYDRDVWWSDDWNPMDYGQDFDFARGFFDQFIEVHNKVPHANIYMVESENSEYTNFATHNKNCYLIFGSWFDQDCLYGNSIYHLYESHTSCALRSWQDRSA